MGKQEHETSLSGGEMAGKTHPRVELRGRLDSLSAMVVELQILAERQGLPSLVNELEEVKDKLYEILSCEVTGEACGDLSLWGLNSDEIRERSHHPERYFGLGHIRPHYTMGVIAAGLNSLRTQIRETELSACRAFTPGVFTPRVFASGVSTPADGETERPDIIKSLNRLSSAAYVLTYKYLPDGYDKTVRFRK